MLIDSHAHLSDEMLCSKQEDILSRLIENEIELVIEIGADIDSSTKALELASKYSSVYAAVGMHPQEADTYTSCELAKLERLAVEPRVVAIGEIGLDYHYDYDKVKQKELMISQIEIAHRLRKPVILHLRDAYQDMYDILRSMRESLTDGVLMHCYSGSNEMIDQFKFLDPYYAFGGAITFKNNNRAEVIRHISKDRLMIETDCPYMTPVPLRGQINTPLNIKYVAMRMAEDLGLEYNTLVELTTANAKRFFNI